MGFLARRKKAIPDLGLLLKKEKETMAKTGPKKKEEVKEKGKEDVLEFLLKGERLTKKIVTKRGTFVIAFPLPKDIRDIEVTVANRLDGTPIAAFTSDSIANFRCYATLDAVIVDAPDWWDKLTSAEDCPDDALVLEIYRGYLQFYQQTQQRISRSKFRGSSAVGKARTASPSMDPGAFQDIADG